MSCIIPMNAWLGRLYDLQPESLLEALSESLGSARF